MISLFAMGANVSAVTVHTWIDDDGVRHYSDEPPVSAATAPEQIVIADTFATATKSDDDYYSIVNQWQRMREEREESNALKLERERIRAEERAAKAAARADATRYDSRRYGGYFPYGFGPRFGHHGALGVGGFHHGPAGGFAPSRRNTFVKATPPVWPRLR